MTNASRRLDVYDKGGGAVLLAWSTFAPFVPSGYNVYVNGALKQSNVAGLTATVTGLTEASYNSSTGVKTPSGTYDFKVVALNAGVESSATLDTTITLSPTTIMLVTPMTRPFPFPNTDT